MLFIKEVYTGPSRLQESSCFIHFTLVATQLLKIKLHYIDFV